MVNNKEEVRTTKGVIGCSISTTIEVLQFCFMKGFSELDDVMHNTLGCILGYSLWLMVHGLWLRVNGERVKD